MADASQIDYLVYASAGVGVQPVAGATSEVFCAELYFFVMNLKKSLHSNSNINQFVPASDVPSPFLGVDPDGIALEACFFNSSYMKRVERQPVASHGEIFRRN